MNFWSWECNLKSNSGLLPRTYCGLHGQDIDFCFICDFSFFFFILRLLFSFSIFLFATSFFIRDLKKKSEMKKSKSRKKQVRREGRKSRKWKEKEVANWKKERSRMKNEVVSKKWSR